MSCEGSRLGQGCEIAEEVQGAGVEGGGQTFEEQASEQPGERFDGQEEVWSAGDPARAIGREATARHDAVDVGMVRQRLPPGVEDGDDADPGAEPAWIGGERRHCLGGGFEQDRINDGLVLKGDRGDRSRQCEDDVEIGNRQQVGFSRGEPRGPGWPLTLRTVPVAARIIGDACRAAVVASLHVATERLGPARHDRAHHAPLDPTEMTGMYTAIGVAMPAQNIGNLDAGPVGAGVGADHHPHPAADHLGGVTSSDRRSSGLCVARIVSVATCV